MNLIGENTLIPESGLFTNFRPFYKMNEILRNEFLVGISLFRRGKNIVSKNIEQYGKE
jgi:hypothetical protein